MFILEIALLVSSFKDNPGNTSAAATELTVADSLATGEGTWEPLTEDESLAPRFRKQGRQYTGLPGLGRKGIVVEVPHSVHTASKCFARLEVRVLFEIVFVCKLKRTPWFLEMTWLNQRLGKSASRQGPKVNYCGNPRRVNQTRFQP